MLLRKLLQLLINESIEGSVAANDVMYKPKSEREVRNRKECAANKLFDAFKSCRVIRVCVQNHQRTEICKNCKLTSLLEMTDKLNSAKNPEQNARKITSINVHGTNFIRHPPAESRVKPAKTFPSILLFP